MSDLIKQIDHELDAWPRTSTLCKTLRDCKAEIERLSKPYVPSNTRDDFLQGICVALTALSADGQSVMWKELVQTAGVDDLLNYAAHIEPDEWELAGFSKFAKPTLNRRKPRKAAAIARYNEQRGGK